MHIPASGLRCMAPKKSARQGIASVLCEQSPDPFEVFWCVHAAAWRCCTHVHSNALAVPQHPQLFQRLGELQWRGLKAGEAAQETCAIAVYADVAKGWR